MITIIVAGRIGRDAELRNTQSGSVLSFPVASDSGYGQNKKTEWFKCSIWGKRGESLAQYIQKGGSVTVSGNFSTSIYTTQDGEVKTTYDINVNEVELQGGGQQQATQQKQAPQQQQAPAQDFGNDVPF